MSIRWDALDRQTYEDMISVLLSRLYPEAQRIDGKGGDGGRDVQIVYGPGGSISHAFELKSFTGRMGTTQRKQVVRSLKRASTLEPEQWTLVVPIDPTPREDDWFRQLQVDYYFPIEWRGKTWLDDKMSAFPDIQRYFLEGAKDEVYRLLREIGQERARVTDVHEAVGRLRTLMGRLDEIDPHYRYEFATGIVAANSRPSYVTLSVSLGDVRVDVYPKYNGASKDRPITISLNIVVDPEYESIQSSLDYGLGATIPSHLISSLVVDAPAGLGGSLTGYEVAILPTDASLDAPITLALDVMDGDRLLASCPIHLTGQTRGLKGSIFSGSDSTGWLKASLKFNVVARESAVEFKLDPKPILPSSLMPLWQWLTALQPECELRIRWPGELEMRSTVQASSSVDEKFGRVIEAYAYLQGHSGIYWEITPSLIYEEGTEVVTAANLLKGEKIDLEWKSINLNLDQWGPKLEELMDGQPRSFLIDQDMRLELEGAAIQIGRVRTHIESACLANPWEVQRALTSGYLSQMQLVPGDNNNAQQFVVSELR